MSYPSRQSNGGCIAGLFVLIIALLQLAFYAAVFSLAVWAFFNFVV